MTASLHSSEEIVSERPPSTHDDSPPSTTPVVGVEKERVDPYTLQIIDQLFPGHHGVKFLAGILRLAVAKQLALPELEIHQVADVAVITVQNIRILAQLIGMSYDTTEKYIVILSHLRLLYKQRQRRQIVLHFPLCRCQLPEPEVLDQIQEMRPASQTPRYRPKVRSFANQVKRRFVLLRKNGQLTAPRSVPQAIPADQLRETLLEDIRHILQQEVDSETGSRLFLKVEGAVRYRCSRLVSRLSCTTGNSEEEEDIVEGALQGKESPVSRAIVDSEGEVPGQQSRLSRTTGDSFSHGTPLKGRLRAPKGDSETCVPVQESPVANQKVDSDRHQVAQNGRLSASTRSGEHTTGDFEAHASGEVADNVNVILRKKIELLNVNVDEVATYLCSLFGEHLKKKGYYKNLRDTQGCRSVDAWLAAVIETAQAISRRRSDAVEKPGGYFYKRCLALHREGIPPQTLQLVQQYGALSYQQLLEILQQAPGTRLMLPLPLPEQQSGRPRPKGNEITRRIERPSKAIPGMTREAYGTLIADLKAGANTKRMRSVPYQQDDGSILLLVEDWVGSQRWIWSLEEWRQCAHSIQRSLWPSQMKKSTSGNYHVQEGNKN